jgi:hypothetical protein
MTVGYLLFLQERLKDIIIIITGRILLGKALNFRCPFKWEVFVMTFCSPISPACCAIALLARISSFSGDLWERMLPRSRASFMARTRNVLQACRMVLYSVFGTP